VGCKWYFVSSTLLDVKLTAMRAAPTKVGGDPLDKPAKKLKIIKNKSFISLLIFFKVIAENGFGYPIQKTCIFLVFEIF